MLEIKSLNNATLIETKKFNHIVALVNKTLVSESLKELILAHKKLDGSLGFENTDDTNEQVWQKIQNTLAYGVSIDVTMYWPNFFQRFHNNVVGYEDDNGMHINKTFFDSFDPCDAGNNVAHESIHEIGYTHDFESTDRRPYSAPYAIGAMVGAFLLNEQWPSFDEVQDEVSEVQG